MPLPRFPSLPRSAVIRVAGTGFHQNELRAIRPNDLLQLVREPENEHDPNAIKVMFKNLHVGYIPAEYAVGMAPLIDATGVPLVAVDEVSNYRDNRSGKVLWGLSIRITLKEPEDAGTTTSSNDATA